MTLRARCSTERVVKIMNRNRITIPKDAFECLGLSSGDYVLVKWDKNHLEITPVDIKPRI